MHVGA
jgi:hypothetical protein